MWGGREESNRKREGKENGQEEKGQGKYFFLLYVSPLAIIPFSLFPSPCLYYHRALIGGNRRTKTYTLLHFAKVVKDFSRREHTKLLLIIDHPDLNVFF